MKTFSEFLETAKDQIKQALPEAEVKIQQINKLQGESYVGISVQPEGAAAAVTFNINPSYEQYQADESKEGTILDKIAADAKRTAASIPAFELSDITEYEKVRDHLVMQAVPAERNKDMLADIPHRKIEDIAVVYRIELPDSPDSSATTLVTNKLLEQYGIKPEQLHEDAVTSQTRNHPPLFMNMSDMMTELSGSVIDLPESPLWVATVKGGQYGAAVIQIPEFMEKTAEQLGGDFFILPSSVHECLFILDDGSYNRKELEDMVQSVNATEVSEAEFLSDSVYHYDSKAHTLEKAASFESRAAEPAAVYETETLEVIRETITVLLVEPEKYPQKIELGTELTDLQKAVGGNIEVIYPFDDPVGLVMNEEGKLEGLPLNRALRDDEGNIYDVIAGSFLVVGLTEDDFGSLTPEQLQKYEEHFHQPEVFIRMGKGIMSLPIPDEAIDLQKLKTEARADNSLFQGNGDKAIKPHKKEQGMSL